jgi:hypothetical protein
MTTENSNSVPPEAAATSQPEDRFTKETLTPLERARFAIRAGAPNRDLLQALIGEIDRLVQQLEAAALVPHPPLLHETKALSPWQPETDRLRLAILGKLGEELAEAGAMVSRCIIQGINESEPVTQVPNRLALQKELADVYATARMAIDHFKLDIDAMGLHQRRKEAHLRAWHGLITAAPALVPSPALSLEDRLVASAMDGITAFVDADGDPSIRADMKKLREGIRLAFNRTSGSCLLCGHDRPFAVRENGTGVCEICRAASRGADPAPPLAR